MPDTRIALVGGGAFVIEIVSANVALVGIGDVEDAAVGRQCDAVRPALRLGDQLQFTVRRKMVDAVEIQVLRVLLISERRIGEIDLAVLADRDVVGRVQPLAFVALGDHFDPALFVGARHAAGVGFAGVQPALRIERVPHRAVRFFTERSG